MELVISEKEIEKDEQGRPKYNENGDRILYPRQWVPAPEVDPKKKKTYKPPVTSEGIVIDAPLRRPPGYSSSYQIKMRKKVEEEEKRKVLNSDNSSIMTPKKTKTEYSYDIPSPGITFSPISPGFVASPSILYTETEKREKTVPKRLFEPDDGEIDLLDDYGKGGRRKSRKSKKSRKIKKSKKSRKIKKSKKSRKH